MTPLLVNGLDSVCAWHQSGCHAENLLLQVWVSLFRFRKHINNRISIIQGNQKPPTKAKEKAVGWTRFRSPFIAALDLQE